jgi:hypothetical protein
MIYLTEEELRGFLGTPSSGLAKAWFQSTSALDFSTDAFDYNIGFRNGLSIYAFITRNSTARANTLIPVAEAQALRALTGKGGVWKLETTYTADKNPKELQQLLDDVHKDLSYTYAPTSLDRSQTPLQCVHQKSRTQVVIFHPAWLPSLDELRKE